jgi:hypothetical protein
LHGKAYYIFLKSLRSLEEFRKNPHVKIPPKSPSTNFQSLDKFKNPVLIQKFIFFLIFGPADAAARLASGPASPLATLHPTGRKRPAGPSSPRVGRVFTGNTFFFLDHAFPSRPPPPSVTATRAPPVGFIVSTAPADLGLDFPRTAAPPRRCPAPRMLLSIYSPPSSLPPLNPLQTER